LSEHSLCGFAPRGPRYTKFISIFCFPKYFNSIVADIVLVGGDAAHGGYLDAMLTEGKSIYTHDTD